MTSGESSNKNNPQGIIVLGVNIHCEGCGNEVVKYLRGFEGVEGVEIDGKNNKVSVKGKMADPIKVTQRLRNKIKWKHIELISPKPQPHPQKQDREEKKKPPEAKVIEVVLKMYIHCESCVKEVKDCILKMEGVERVDPNMEKNEVRVKGRMNPEKLVEFIKKRGRRHAKIVKQQTTGPNQNQNHNQNQNQNQNKNQNKNNATAAAAPSTWQCHDNDKLRLVYAPQLFSDENPNSCSLM